MGAHKINATYTEEQVKAILENARVLIFECSKSLAAASAAGDQLRIFIDGDGNAGPNLPRADPPAPDLKIEGVAQCILEAAPCDVPITLTELAKRAGYQNTAWFREHVDSLVVARQIIRSAKGFMRAV